MVKLTWSEDATRDPFGGQPEPVQVTRWFDDEERAREWARGALLPGTYQIKTGEKPVLSWFSHRDDSWAAQHRQRTYVIHRVSAVWCPVVENYELTYLASVDRVEFQDGDGAPRKFPDLEAAMAACDVEAFGS